MAADWTDWADGNDLAGMSRSTSPLGDAGYDVDALRVNPQQRTQAMAAMAAPYVLAAQPPRGTSSGAASAPAATMPQPAAPAAPPTATPQAASPAAGSSATPPPTANDVTSLDAAGREAIRQSLALGQAEQKRATELAANPAPDTSALETKIEQESAPTPYRDASGKPLPDYAPSTLSRIGRGVKGAALGFLEGGPFGAGIGAIDPGMVRGGTDYGAPNQAYETADATRQTQLGQDTQSLQNLRDRWKDMVQSNKDVTAASTGANAAYGNTVKGIEDLTPKPEAVKAQSVLNDAGQPIMGNYQDGKWTDAQGRPIQNPRPLPPNSPTEAKPVLNDAGKPVMGNFQNGKWTDAQGRPIQNPRPVPPAREAAGGAGGIPGMGNGTLNGEEYLRTLPPEMASTVRAIGEGREAPPSAGNRSKAAMAILNAVNQAYPTYDATQYPTYASARKTFTAGPIGTAINSFNTALQHLNRMEANIPEENSGFSTINAVENKLAPSGSKRALDVGRFKTDANAVSNEVQKAYKGGVVNQDEYNHMLELLDPNAAPNQIQSNIAELRQLLHGKLESYRQQWASQGPPGMPMPVPGIDTAAPTAAAGGGASSATGGNFDWGTGFHPLPAGKQ